MYLSALSACTTCMIGAHRDQKSISDPVDLQLDSCEPQCGF